MELTLIKRQDIMQSVQTLFLNSTLTDKIDFYNRAEFVENPCHPNGFNGTFAFSIHRAIPHVFHAFLQRHFGQYRISRVPIADINTILNDIWEGPGSLEKIFVREDELFMSRKDVKFTASDIVALKSKMTEHPDDVPLSTATLTE